MSDTGAPSGTSSERPPMQHAYAAKSLPQKPNIVCITKANVNVQTAAKNIFNNVYHAMLFFKYKKTPKAAAKEMVLRCKRTSLGSGAFNHELVSLFFQTNSISFHRSNKLSLRS